MGPVMRTAGNFKSEGRSFAKSNRCLIPASAFFEFTGKKYPKTKHSFTLNDAPFLAIAGLWRETEGKKAPAFTMLTTEPGEDVKPYHNRQVVVLQPADLGALVLSYKAGARIAPPIAARLAQCQNSSRGAVTKDHHDCHVTSSRESLHTPPGAVRVETTALARGA